MSSNRIGKDWTIVGWKIDPLGDDLIAFLCGCGGSSLIGQEAPNTFDDLGIELRAHYGDTGRARAQAAFTAEKVGEQNRVAPVFVSVYNSENKQPNHYEPLKGLTIVLGNRRAVFDTANQSHRVRFQKADGTWVTAAGYPYIKGSTIVCLPPTGLTGQVTLELTLEINGSIRTGIYPFPLS